MDGVADITVAGRLEFEAQEGPAAPRPAPGAPSLGLSDTAVVSVPPDPAGTSRPFVAPPAAAPSANGGCTAAQLRRFIKSRAYVPMHELRRRFVINGAEDDVTRVSTGAGHVFVGLPPREGQLLGELLRGGDIGYELSLDPVTPVVIGVYPMRPVSRS